LIADDEVRQEAGYTADCRIIRYKLAAQRATAKTGLSAAGFPIDRR
jgi:hypothetical protein